jgi:BCD family chlorophyll transporter-like MFS transporter
VVLTALAVIGIERRVAERAVEADGVPLRQGLAEIWEEPRARRFTLFIFLSMTAYFLQELVLEPYAGLVFAFSPGQSTSLSGAQNGGVFLGMLAVGAAVSWLRIGSLRGWVVAGCVGSALALMVIAALGQVSAGLLVPAVVLLGLCNGIFAVAAIGAMMSLAGEGRRGREGTRMGLWGASQALAAGFGGLLGAASVDVLRLILPDATAFGLVFMAEAGLFLAAALLGLRVVSGQPIRMPPSAIAGE